MAFCNSEGAWWHPVFRACPLDPQSWMERFKCPSMQYEDGLGKRWGAHQMIWSSSIRTKTSSGTHRCTMILCSAALWEAESRQSVDRMPLVTVKKAKLAALNTQWSAAGVGIFTPPSRVIYCSHNCAACIKIWVLLPSSENMMQLLDKSAKSAEMNTPGHEIWC